MTYLKKESSYNGPGQVQSLDTKSIFPRANPTWSDTMSKCHRGLPYGQPNLSRGPSCIELSYSREASYAAVKVMGLGCRGADSDMGITSWIM
ncbi:hypothetical protein SADUNF_Sadunf16G0168500 [Salix dunnii]|uniref:Uncharacterized protein n=1 Tax=Salix dunnii TaxID=1413687 RepID=A0A835MQG8_9ROSI|nr:hypothetical protein SADUNF_Sadunf16G0168500 [Salix dunnii]